MKSKTLHFVSALLITLLIAAGTIGNKSHKENIDVYPSPYLVDVQRGGNASGLRPSDSTMENSGFESRFSDQLIDVRFGWGKELEFYSILVENKTGNELEIDWRKVSFVDHKDDRTKVLVSGVTVESEYQYEKRDVRRRIAPGESRKESVIPFSQIRIPFMSDGVFEITESGITTKGMVVRPLAGEVSMFDREGFEYEIWIPIQIAGNTAQYVFEFRIK